MLIRTRRELVLVDHEGERTNPKPLPRPVRRVRNLIVSVQRSQLQMLSSKTGSSARASAAIRLLVRMAIRGVAELSEGEIATEMGQSLGDTVRRNVYLSEGQFQLFESVTGDTAGRHRRMKAAVRVLIRHYLTGKLRIEPLELELESRRAVRRVRSR